MPAAIDPPATARLLTALFQAPAEALPLLADLETRERQGHTGMPIREDLGAWLCACGLAARPGQEAPTAPLVVDGDWVATRRAWSHERDLAMNLITRATRPCPPPDPDTATALAKAFPDSERALAIGGVNWQHRALQTAWTHGASLITGGPGCGKTTVAGRLAALLCQQARAADLPAPLVVLAAPTGKAAARLGEAVRQAVEPVGLDPGDAAAITGWTSTLHRLFHHPRANEVDVAIIDEVSMASAATLGRVLARLPAHCRVVLLGDPDQLASVEPGRVLGDLAGVPDDHPLATATVRLRVNWRSGAAPALATLVRGLQEGDPRALAWVETPMPQESNTWVHRCDLPTRPGSLLQALATTHHPWIDRILTDARQDPGQALLALEQVRLLTVLRQGDWGSDALNQRWEELLCRNGRIHPDAQGHYLGRPLLVTANRPDLDLSNGDIGVVSPMDGGWALRVPAIDGTRAVPLHRLEGLQPAWFLTVHKAQGSQGEHVEVIGLPTDATTAQRQLATREMAYTAITRASRRLRIWWDAPGLAASLTTRETARRSSQLAMLLKRGAAAQPAA